MIGCRLEIMYVNDIGDIIYVVLEKIKRGFLMNKNIFIRNMKV